MTPTQRQHTNPPWAYTRKPSKSYSDHGMREICNTGDFMVYIPKERVSELLNASEENAKFIVKAVNSHEQLVKTLKEQMLFNNQNTPNSKEAYCRAFNLLESLASAQKEG